MYMQRKKKNNQFKTNVTQKLFMHHPMLFISLAQTNTILYTSCSALKHISCDEWLSINKKQKMATQKKQKIINLKKLQNN